MYMMSVYIHECMLDMHCPFKWLSSAMLGIWLDAKCATEKEDSVMLLEDIFDLSEQNCSSHVKCFAIQYSI